jgi:transposase
MFQDEARFGRITSTSKAWAPIGIRPAVAAQLVREYIYVYGSVEPKTGDTFNLILPNADTVCMQLYLNQLSETYLRKIIVLFADSAIWHTTDELVIPTNIRLIPLPPYSPELNPEEHVWDHIREKYFPNKTFPSLDALEEALCEALKKVSLETDVIKKLTNFSWLHYGF